MKQSTYLRDMIEENSCQSSKHNKISSRLNDSSLALTNAQLCICYERYKSQWEAECKHLRHSIVLVQHSCQTTTYFRFNDFTLTELILEHSTAVYPYSVSFLHSVKQFSSSQEIINHFSVSTHSAYTRNSSVCVSVFRVQVHSSLDKRFLQTAQHVNPFHTFVI